MASRYGRLDRLLSKQTGVSLRALKAVLAAGRVTVDDRVVRQPDCRVGPFNGVALDGEVIREAETAWYLMLNKPPGVVSATRDSRHRTVIDLLTQSPFAAAADQVHIAGRLDATSTGLMLLTNDGVWSRAVCGANSQVTKTYRVDTAQPLKDSDVADFAGGMYFATEDVTLRPARLDISAPCAARVTLQEGRYHQIRRMFTRVDNRVTRLHREAIGPWTLPDSLAPGAFMAVPDPQQLPQG